METEQRIRTFDRYLSRLQPPLAASSEAPEIMAALTKNNYFISICDEAFGPLKPNNEGMSRHAIEAAQNEYYWMDEANNSAEDSSICTALMRLLGPNGSLFSIMEQTSQPCSTFNTLLKGMWKGGSDRKAPAKAANAEHQYRSTSLLPLPCLCDFSADILSENPDRDLAALPRERIIPLMLLPFWDPPVDSRTVVSRPPQTDSLQSTMLGYFLFRMFHWANVRCGHHGRHIITPPPPTTTETVNVWVDKLRSLVMGKEIVNRPSTKSFHFFQRLVTEYIQHFVKASSFEAFHTKSYTQHSGKWTEREIMSLIMLQGPAGMWLHRSNRPISEYDRVRINDPNALALAAQSLWHLEASFVCLEGQVEGRGILSDSRDYGVLACADLMWPLRTCYRSCLIAVRTMAMSLPFFQCADRPYRDLIRLWRAIITSPAEADTAAMSTYFFHHYEAFSVLLVEMLEMAQTRPFVEVSSAETMTLLRKALDEFNFDPIPSLLKSVTDLVAAKGKELDRIRKWNALDWSRSDGAPPPVIAPLGEEARNASGKLYLRFKSWIESAKQENPASNGKRVDESSRAALQAKVTAMESVLETLQKVFVTVVADAEAMKAQPSPLRNRAGFLGGGYPFTPTMPAPAAIPFPSKSNEVPSAQQPFIPSTRYHDLAQLGDLASNGAKTMTPYERKEFLLAKRNGFELSKSAKLRFGNGVITSASYDVLKSHEIPVLIPVARFIDTVIDFVQYSIHTKKAVRCPRGHVLSLVGDSRLRCANHTMNRAVYECHSCRASYCESCSGPPAMGNGSKVRPCFPTVTGASCCDRCNTVFDSPNIIAYTFSKSGGRVWCANCVSRPWNPVSVRFIASRHTYLILLALSFTYFIICMLVASVSDTAARHDTYYFEDEGFDERYAGYWMRNDE